MKNERGWQGKENTVKVGNGGIKWGPIITGKDGSDEDTVFVKTGLVRVFPFSSLEILGIKSVSFHGLLVHTWDDPISFSLENKWK